MGWYYDVMGHVVDTFSQRLKLLWLKAPEPSNVSSILIFVSSLDLHFLEYLCRQSLCLIVISAVIWNCCAGALLLCKVMGGAVFYKCPFKSQFWGASYSVLWPSEVLLFWECPLPLWWERSVEGTRVRVLLLFQHKVLLKSFPQRIRFCYREGSEHIHKDHLSFLLPSQKGIFSDLHHVTMPADSWI